MAKAVEMTFAIGAALSGNFAATFSKAGQVFSELQKKSQDLQKISGKIENYQKMQSAITANQNAMLGLRQQAQNLDTQIASSTAKTSELRNQYNAAQREVTVFNEANIKNSDAYKVAILNAKSLENQIKSSAQPTAELQQKYAAAQKEVRKFQNAVKLSSNELKSARTNTQRLKTEMKASERQTQALRTEAKNLASEADILQNKIDRDTNSLSNLSSELKNAGVSTQNLMSEQSRYAAQTEQVTAAQERLAKARERVSSIKSQLTWNNMKGDLMASAASIMAFKRPIQVGMNFEQAMAQVKAVLSPTEEEFKELRDQSIMLGSTTQFSATQAAHSQENLARAGLSKQEIIDALPSVLSMAAAEGMDLDQAANILAGALGGMGLKADSSSRVADVLAMTSASSKTNIANLGEAFKVAAPIAAQIGVSVEELSSYLGVMANKNFEGSEAGNALASSLMRLQQRPKQAADALNALGVSTRTKDGKVRKIPDLMLDLNKKLSTMGEGKQLEYLANIFGKQQAKAMSALLQGVVSGDESRIYQKNMNSSGKSAEMAKVRNDSLQGDITALGSAWEGLQIRIAKAIEPVNRFITQTLTTGISKLNEFISEHETLCSWITRIAYALAGWKVFRTAWKYGKLLVQLPFAKLQESLATSAAQAAISGEKIGIFSSALNALKHPISFLKNGFKMLWGVIAAHPFMAIITAVSLVIVYWDDIKAAGEKFMKWWNGELTLRDIFGPIYDDAVAVIEKLTKPFVDFAKWLSDLFESINPFAHWDAPKTVTIGGVTHSTGGSGQVANAFNALNDSLPPSIGHAKGGIFSQPHLGLVAEAGREAIIPLENHSRGEKLWFEAGRELGIIDKAKSMNVQNQNVNNAMPLVIETLKNQPSFNVGLSDLLKSGAISAHAKGGIFSQPHLGLVAEAGREAIIPLEKRSRGTNLWLEAGRELGIIDNTKFTNSNNNYLQNFLSGKIPQVSQELWNGISIFNTDNSVAGFSNEISNISGISDILENHNDNSFGMPLWKAADEEMETSFRNSSVTNNNTNNANNYTNQSPVNNINITVNGSDSGIAERIRQAVEDALRNIQDYESRVSFA